MKLALNRTDDNELLKLMILYLQEEFLLILREVPVQDVPQPEDDTVRVVEATVVLRVSAEVYQVQWHVISRDQSLQL